MWYVFPDASSSALSQNFVTWLQHCRPHRPHGRSWLSSSAQFCLAGACRWVQGEREAHDEMHGLILPLYSSQILCTINRLDQPFLSSCHREEKSLVWGLWNTRHGAFILQRIISTFKLYFSGWVSSTVLPVKGPVLWEQYQQALQVSALLEFFGVLLNAEPDSSCLMKFAVAPGFIWPQILRQRTWRKLESCSNGWGILKFTSENGLFIWGKKMVRLFPWSPDTRTVLFL